MSRAVCLPRSRLLGSATPALTAGGQAAVAAPARGMVELLQQEEQEALDAGLDALASSSTGAQQLRESSR